jgi:hypothetical protein
MENGELEHSGENNLEQLKGLHVPTAPAWETYCGIHSERTTGRCLPLEPHGQQYLHDFREPRSEEKRKGIEEHT